jgi:hypothetical protein
VLNPVSTNPSRWTAATPDLLALLYALGLAWFLKWEVRDLVWSLWLSSLLVGYATILLTIFGPMLTSFRNDTHEFSAAVAVGGGLFMLLFFTVHFGMFHLVHSVFLNVFFPVLPGEARGFPGAGMYFEVLKSYWPFVLGAAVSERTSLRQSVARTNVMGPYKNVIRMHLLIFFFAGAAAAKLDSFLVYAVVLCVYFFPLKLFFGKPSRTTESSTASDQV